MKKLMIGLLLTTSISTFACSCDFTGIEFKTPYGDEIVEMRLKKMGFTVKDSEEVAYYPTLLEHIIYSRLHFDKEKDQTSCDYETPDGKFQHHCEQGYHAKLKVTVNEKDDCHIIMKVKRKKRSYSSKILKNTCK